MLQALRRKTHDPRIFCAVLLLAPHVLRPLSRMVPGVRHAALHPAGAKEATLRPVRNVIPTRARRNVAASNTHQGDHMMIRQTQLLAALRRILSRCPAPSDYRRATNGRTVRFIGWRKAGRRAQ